MNRVNGVIAGSTGKEEYQYSETNIGNDMYIAVNLLREEDIIGTNSFINKAIPSH